MLKKFIAFFLLILVAFSLKAFAKSDKQPINVNYSDGIYHIILSGPKMYKRIKFVSNDTLTSNYAMHRKTGSQLTVNAGYFDPKNQKTISYVINDNITDEDPMFNENLLANPVLRKNLDKIKNRTEFRIINCNGKFHYEIAPHSNNIDYKCSIETSVQAGPMLLPELRLEEEFFIVKNSQGKIIRESASVLEKTARTLIGIKNTELGDEVHIFIVTNDNPQTIYESRELCKSYDLDSAMAFDGGSSTSFNYKDINITSTNSGGRKLKSFLIVR